MANTGHQPLHRSMVIVDVEGFGAGTRSNPIRATLRESLAGILTAALTRSIGDDKRWESADLGDGLLVLVEPDVPKPRLVRPLVEELLAGLRDYNRSADAAAQMRLRMVLHAGEVVHDAQGYTSDDLNHAFRLLEADQLRRALSTSSLPLALIASDVVYQTVIRQRYNGIDPDEYARIRVRVKETDAAAWLWSPDEPPAPAVGSAPHLGVRRRPREIALHDLPPTSLHVSIADVHNYRLYGLHSAEVPLGNHVEAALLLGRHAIMHCADPYRSTEVTALATEFEDCVRDGSLLFLLSEVIADPRRHFQPYIERRSRNYGLSPYGETDVDSLRVPDPEAALERTIRLLELSPVLLHRGFSGTSAFPNIVKADMNPAERIVVSDTFYASAISNLSLTLRQILELTQLGPNGMQTRLVADADTVADLRTSITNMAGAGHEYFSRQMLLSLIHQKLRISVDDPFYELIAARVSVIHLRSTMGNTSFLEVTNNRDRVSPYYYGHLLDHLGALANCPPRAEFGVGLVKDLRNLECWRHFANYHLRLMADIRARHIGGDPAPDARPMYEASGRIREFRDIRALVRDAWEA